MTAPDPDVTPAGPEEVEPIQPDVPEPEKWPGPMWATLSELEKVQRARELFNGSNEIDSGMDYPVAQRLLELLENGLKREFAAQLLKRTMERSEGWDPHARD